MATATSPSVRTALLPGTAYIVAFDAPEATRWQAQLIKGTSVLAARYGDLIQICDGIADQVEIQAAINALPVAGGRVILSAGHFNVGATIRMCAGLTLEGQGWDSVIFAQNSMNAHILWNATGAGDITIRNLRIDGNADNQSQVLGDEWFGILFFGPAEHFLLENIYFYHTHAVGVTFQNNANYGVARGLRGDDLGYVNPVTLENVYGMISCDSCSEMLWEDLMVNTAGYAFYIDSFLTPGTYRNIIVRDVIALNCQWCVNSVETLDTGVTILENIYISNVLASMQDLVGAPVTAAFGGRGYLRNVKYSNIRLIDAPDHHGFHLTCIDCNRITVDGFIAENIPAALEAFIIQGLVDDVEIRHVRVDEGGGVKVIQTAAEGVPSNVKLYDVWADFSNVRGIFIEGQALTPITGVRMDKCYARHSPVSNGISIHHATGIEIFDSHTIDNVNAGLVLQNCEHVKIRGGHYEQLAGWGNCIWFEQPVTNAIVTGLRCLGIHGILEGAGCDYNTYKGNNLRGCTTAGYSGHVGVHNAYDKVITPLALDLSGGATDIAVFYAQAPCQLVGYHILYSEATGAAAGVNIRVGRYADGVALDDDHFDVTVSEVNQGLGYALHINTAALINSMIPAGSTVTVGTAGGLGGLGEVKLILKIAEMSEV